MHFCSVGVENFGLLVLALETKKLFLTITLKLTRWFILVQKVNKIWGASTRLRHEHLSLLTEYPCRSGLRTCAQNIAEQLRE